MTDFQVQETERAEMETLRAELALARRERERYLIFVEDMLNSRDPDVRRRAEEALDG